MLLERSEVSFNACVLACSRARQWQMALAVFDELQESSLEVEAMCPASRNHNQRFGKHLTWI